MHAVVVVVRHHLHQRFMFIALAAAGCRMDNPDFDAAETGVVAVEPATTEGPPGTSTADVSDGTTASTSAAGSGTGETGDASAPTDSPCPVEAVLCGAVCVDLLNNEAHCGKCELSCADDEYCDAGRCAPGCPKDRSLCGVECVDLQRDEAHCGACDVVCPQWSLCIEGVCDCVGWGELCDGACVDMRTDENHCGECGNACDPGESCKDSACN